MHEERRERVYGPYKHGNRWRVVVTRADGERVTSSFESEAEAERVADAARGQAAGSVTLKAAVDLYIKSLVARGLRFSTYERAEYHLKRLLQLEQNSGRRVSWLARRGGDLYDASQAGARVDTHRNGLAAGRAFGKFCVKKQWLRANPFSDVDGAGRRRKGKPQLTVDESRKLLDFCLERFVEQPNEAAAVVAALLLGPRASEVVQRDVRDLDNGGRLLWIPDSKTDAGKRQLEVPDVLRPLLLGLARDRIGATPLFRDRDGDRPTRWWLAYWVDRMRTLAKVPRVTPQGLRGTHASLARRGGATGELVAAQLGHASVTMQERTYATDDAMQAGATVAVLRAIRGDKP